MKKLIALICSVFLAVAILVPLSACDRTTRGGSATGSSDIEISDPKFGFVREDEYDAETFDMNTAVKWTTLDADTDYYLFLTFDVTARRNNDGQSLLNVNITFDALDIMNGTMEDVSTGMLEEMTFLDATSGNVGKTTKVSFKIPSLSAQPKTINMIITLKPVREGESHIIIGYDFNAPKEYKLLGSDGYTKNLKIVPVQIQAPVLTLNSNGVLIWQHVKNADYYQIFEVGTTAPLTDFYGEQIVVLPEATAVGGNMMYNIGQYIMGYHMLVVRAYSNNASIRSSNSSNEVEHTW